MITYRHPDYPKNRNTVERDERDPELEHYKWTGVDADGRALSDAEVAAQAETPTGGGKFGGGAVEGGTAADGARGEQVAETGAKTDGDDKGDDVEKDAEQHDRAEKPRRGGNRIVTRG